ncbi:MAG: hypothetical protein HY695_01755 [Deltaproteobacteria bacterium]|nr:hypothetical protein [Deltaproteobacteria bacterium]
MTLRQRQAGHDSLLIVPPVRVDPDEVQRFDLVTPGLIRVVSTSPIIAIYVAAEGKLSYSFLYPE